jgi:hypothetical protein
LPTSVHKYDLVEVILKRQVPERTPKITPTISAINWQWGGLTGGGAIAFYKVIQKYKEPIYKERDFLPWVAGNLYDLSVARMLRPFNWELAALGHPLADINSGTEVRLLRTEGNPREPGSVLYAYDKWITADDRQPTPAWKTNNYLFCNEVGAKIALAPLAVKEGKPLHVGDTICYKGQGDWWCVGLAKKPATGDGSLSLSWYAANLDKWRWP